MVYLCILLFGILSAAVSISLFSAGTVYADEAHSAYASSSEMGTQKEIVKYGMTPISGEFLADGSWEIEVESSSSFFNIHSCELIVEDGSMEAKLTMETYSYPLLYLGTAEEAAAADASDYIEYEEIDDWYVFTVPVKALNMPIDCAAFSKKKEKWYNRQILFDASTLSEEALNSLELPDYDLIEDGLEALEPETGSVADSEQNSIAQDNFSVPAEIDLADGRYSINVALTGGSGRASVSTPTLLIVEDGKAYAELLWSSSHYDWMQVGGVIYENEAEEGANSLFTIPISAFDSVIPVIADTTAMGDPVAIEYSLTFYEESIGDEGLIPQVAAKKVVIFAIVIIVGGFFLNLYVKKRRKV
ncbi:MAG: hypothetical protein Q4B03_08265 [Lachnospiraceae bacterium]|nr:hypothetical protein [Lachnospiraceae bacterium]